MSQLTCEQAVDQLMDFLKQELPPELAAAVLRHLDDCKPCDQHARFEARFVVLIESRLGKDRCPERLKAKIIDSLARERGD